MAEPLRSEQTQTNQDITRLQHLRVRSRSLKRVIIRTVFAGVSMTCITILLIISHDPLRWILFPCLLVILGGTIVDWLHYQVLGPLIRDHLRLSKQIEMYIQQSRHAE
jgi:hypothetical protein